MPTFHRGLERSAIGFVLAVPVAMIVARKIYSKTAKA